jgi:glyoxylase-like metal-dependent hydrolase (beta-lactamase superfamily II)
MTRTSIKISIAILLAAIVLAESSFAAAPMAKTPAPGFHRIMLGDFELSVVSDGTSPLPLNTLLQNTTPAAIGRALAKWHIKLPLETSDNVFVINTGAKLIMVDAGAGKLFGPTLGNFVTNLKAAGYEPEQIDDIYLTHLHGDHVGGLAPEGKMVFPNATVHAEKHDSDFWLSKANMDKAEVGKKGLFEGAMASLGPYVAAGKFKTFDGNADLAHGISAQAGHGHSPGHTTYVIESKGEKLVLIGDMIHVGAVQFDNPAVSIAFDSDGKSAIAERRHEFDAAVKAGYMLGGSHIQFPGLGYVRADGKGYQWIPVNYTQMRDGAR